LLHRVVAWMHLHGPGTRVFKIAIRRRDWTCQPNANANQTITLALSALEALTQRGLGGRTDLDQGLAHRRGTVRPDHVRPLDC
jgi:hypothetical protein